MSSAAVSPPTEVSKVWFLQDLREVDDNSFIGSQRVFNAILMV